MSRNIFDQRQRLNTSWEQYGEFYQPIGSKVNVYQFRKTSGYIRMTTFGEQPISTSTNEYQQVTNIYTGKEPITVVWKDSTIGQVNEDELAIEKIVKVGKYYTCYSTGANINTLETSEITLLGKTYVNTYINKDISLECPDWEVTNDDINEYVYLILDPINKSLQWLEIQEVVPIYNEENKQFTCSKITFANVNLKYAQTGKSILDFIQFGTIGEGYCFPKETILENGDIEVSLDENKLFPNDKKTAYQFQIDLSAGAMLNSLVFIGRTREKVINGKIITESPHYLFPYKVNFPKTSPFFYLQPNSNSFAIFKCFPVKDGIWESYKNLDQAFLGGYNILNKKEVLTGFKIEDSLARGTNNVVNDGYEYTNWDNKRSIRLDQVDYNFDYIPYCKTTKLVDKTFNYAEFLTFNYFVSFYEEAINFTYQETTKYKLTDIIGVLGSIVGILTGGLDIGWTAVSYALPKQPLNFLIPCITYLDGKAALNDAAPLPSDVLTDDKTKSVLPTATNVLTSWNVSLSDRVQDRSQVRDNFEIGKGGKGIWNTKYLGQTKYEDGTWINEDHSPFEIDWNSTQVISPQENNGFLIDFVLYKVVSICDVRISAYNMDGNAIYTAFMETNAKARGEITLWNNVVKFNYYDEFNTIGQVKWPETALAPIPPKTNELIPELSAYGDVFFGADISLRTSANNSDSFDRYFYVNIRSIQTSSTSRSIAMYYEEGRTPTSSPIFAHFPSTLIKDMENECKEINFDFDEYEINLYEGIIFDIEDTETLNSYRLTYDLNFDDQWHTPKEQEQIQLEKTANKTGDLYTIYISSGAETPREPAAALSTNVNNDPKVIKLSGQMEPPSLKLFSNKKAFQFKLNFKAQNLVYSLEPKSGLITSKIYGSSMFYGAADISTPTLFQSTEIKNAYLIRKNTRNII